MERLRSEAEAHIESLIDLLNKIDDFDEREPNTDEEPSLGRTEDGQSIATSTADGPDGELEFASTDGEDRRPESYECPFVDAGEPSLGSIESHPRAGLIVVGRNGPVCVAGADVWRSPQGDQTGWANGSMDEREGGDCADDREETCEDEGAEHDGAEPSLGWTDEEAARGRVYAGAMGRAADLELGVEARPPQDRTDLAAGVSVEVSYRRFLRPDAGPANGDAQGAAAREGCCRRRIHS